MVASPTLYRLAANREYGGIPSRVETHPEDILWTDRYGSTCLHILCQARTNVDDALLRAVRAIVKHRPDVVAWGNVATWTPLHFACEKRAFCQTTTTTTSNNNSNNNVSMNHHNTTNSNNNSNNESSDSGSDSSSSDGSNSSEGAAAQTATRTTTSSSSSSLTTSTRLVLTLIDACPHAVSVPTKTGFKTKTPFHIACEADADYRILRAMLSINPRLAIQPYVQSSDCAYTMAENPLQLLWKNSHHGGSHHKSSSSSSSRGPLSSSTITKRPQRPSRSYSGSQELRDKMALLLQAAHYGTVVLHNSTSSSRSMTLTGVRLLNAACSVRCPRDYVALILRQHASQIVQLEKDEHELLPLQYAVQKAEPDSPAYTHFIVTTLLQAHPEAAAVTDPEGRLPLHTACSVGLTWHKGGVQELTLANTNALRTLDPRTGLVPVLQSAGHALHSRLHLSTTLELLLAAPEMVQPWKWRK